MARDEGRIADRSAELAMRIDKLLYAHEDDEVPQYTGEEIKIALMIVEELTLIPPGIVSKG